MSKSEEIPPSSEPAPPGTVWTCPECGERVRPRYLGGAISGFRVICPVCGGSEYFRHELPWGGSK